jgi:methionyl-tRNA synthetase
MTERIHITTAITYSNGPPHVGHAYEYLATDTFARYMRRKLGRENVTFVTGTDEHGQKNRDAAAKANLDPKSFSDNISGACRTQHQLRLLRANDRSGAQGVRAADARAHL